MIEIFSDFDGTLTNHDTLVVLLDRFASGDWYAIEERMLSGEIKEREGLKAEMAMIAAPDDQLIETLEEEIQPAEGLDELVGLVREKGWPFTVLSGGLIRFSGHLWRKWSYGDIPIYANDHKQDDKEYIEVLEAEIPHIKGHCNHCKRWHVEEAIRRGSEVVYIGDGLTDRCPAEAAHRRYAKGDLLDYLQARRLETVPFKNLREVVENLRTNPL